MALLELGPDELLSTTRAVRKRLDFTKPVPDDLVRECVAMALQAPSGGNQVAMRFVVVRDRATVAAISAVYAQCWEGYQASPGFAGKIKRDTEELQAQQRRVADSATYLAQHMAESPVLVLGCRRRVASKDCHWLKLRGRSATSFRRCGASCSLRGHEASARRGRRSTSRWNKPSPTSSTSRSTLCNRSASRRWRSPKAPTSSRRSAPIPTQ